MSNNKEDAVINELTQTINELTACYRQYIGSKTIDNKLISSIKERLAVVTILMSTEEG